MEQYDFSKDWDRFFDNIDSYLISRQNFEKEYNSICRKAKNQEYSNTNSAACYYYMAAVLCRFYYYELEVNHDSDKKYAVGLGKKAIQSARRFLNEDEEFKTMSLVFDLLFLKHNRQDIPGLFRKLQSIKIECPHIESMEGPLIKTEALRDWFNNAYYDTIFEILFNWEVEDDLKLKEGLAKELINSSNQIDQEVGYANLADALFDMGNYQEAERYAILGKDLYGNLSAYDHGKHFFWGMCWCIYARCQEEAGDMDFAMTLIEKGASLGIPWCMKELEKLEQNVMSLGTDFLDGDTGLSEQERKRYTSRINAPFMMETEAIWDLENYPQIPVVVGRICSGVLRKGDVVVIMNDIQKIEATVFGIAMFGKLLEKAEAGDACGIMLLGEDVDKVQIGSVIHKLS